MKRRWRIWRGNPIANVRLAQMALAGAFACGVAGSGSSSFANISGAGFIVATGWFEGRYAIAVGDFMPEAVRRGALVRIAAGLLAAILGWWLPELIGGAGSGWEARIGAGLLFAGAASMLGGLARLAVTDLATYAGRKLQDRLDDDYQ